MTPSEATQCLTALSAALDRNRDRDPALHDENIRIWHEYLEKLDFTIADRAVAQCILQLRFFPTIAEFREFYASERSRSRPQALPEAEGTTDVPEWVSVWWWNLRRTESARRAANTTSRAKPVDRTPIRMRGFPQEDDPGPNPLSSAEYEKVRAAWVAAGNPMVNAVQELVA